MTFLVPYDGSYLAEAALTRATEYAQALDDDVTAVTVIPDDESYAEERGWYDPDESNEEFSTTYVAGKLHQQVTDIAPEAAFRYETTDVAGGVAEDAEYDVHIVRYFSPTAIQEVETSGSYPTEAR